MKLCGEIEGLTLRNITCMYTPGMSKIFFHGGPHPCLPCVMWATSQ